MSQGWVCVHRKLMQSPIFQDSVAVHLWVHLMLSANHKEGQAIIGNDVITVPKGSLLTGRKSLAKAINSNESKIERVLKVFEKLKQIEQQTFSKYRIISITKWDEYQGGEQQTNSKRTASEQQVNTNNNVNNVNNDKQRAKGFVPPTIQEVQNYIDEKGYQVDVSVFMNHYESNGWMVGKNKMKKWKAAITNWNTRNSNGGNNGQDTRGRAKRVSDKIDELARAAAIREGLT